jgi:hypothetical protein
MAVPTNIIPPTICRDCVFATWDGADQEDCKLGRLDKLEANGAILVPQESGGKRYLSIHNRFCNACINEDSLKGVPRRKWKSHVKEQIAVRCEMVIVAEEGATAEDVKASLRSILDQRHPAKQVTVAVQSQEMADECLVLLKQIKSQIAWQVTMVLPRESAAHQLDPMGTPNYDYMIDRTLEKAKQTYYSVCRAGYRYSPSYLSLIEAAINERLERFVAIFPDADGNGLFVQTMLHEGLKGNAGASITRKLSDLSAELGQEHMIKRFEDLCEWE